MATTSPIGEADLHAYVDGQLDAARRAQVDAHLAENADAARLVRQLRAQIEELHLAYDPVLNEPLPPRLTALSPRPWLAPGLAAGIAGLACGAAAGWFGHAAMQPPPLAGTGFAQRALAAHVLYVAEQRHPVEVPAAQEAHLVAWLSKRLDAPIKAPNLQAHGFSLLGGRLLPGERGPLAQLMYESDGGERLTLTVKNSRGESEQTGFNLQERNGASAFYWIDGGYGYALSGAIGKQRLLALAHSVDEQLRRR
jgi:anti-sigma factor RsiW